MPTQTYIPLATVTLATTATSVTFSSIPATYRDLIIVVNGTGSTSGEYRVRFNGDTGSNYISVYMYAPTPQSGAATNTYLGASIGPTSPQPTIFQVMDYSATDKHKTVLYRTGLVDSGATFYVSANAVRWASTTAITSCSFTMPSGSFNTGLTVNLYGIVS